MFYVFDYRRLSVRPHPTVLKSMVNAMFEGLKRTDAGYRILTQLPRGVQRSLKVVCLVPRERA